ncbi:MAG TPA: OPT/YSL family transporter, partial [Candidatus Baltobacteraceae bacterium]|nr:OPT/YSL family transporter [Candidatus Baltobacteraceae bacterium]
DWSMLGIGALVGIAAIAVDEVLRMRSRGKFHLPPLAVGLGIYLSFVTTAAIVVGAVLGHFYNRWAAAQPNAEHAKQLGVLVASGLIVGESIFGVIFAGLIVVTGQASPIAVVGDAFGPASVALGGIAFLVILLGLYRWTASLAAKRA